MVSFEHSNIHPSYVFGSSIITIVIGALAFITAFAWNSYAQQVFDNMTSRDQELKAKLSYAFMVTALAIIVGFMIMYFVDGDKW